MNQTLKRMESYFSNDEENNNIDEKFEYENVKNKESSIYRPHYASIKILQ